MARYFYVIEDGETIPDRVGSEHQTLAEARHEAVRVMAELLPSRMDDLFDHETLRIVTTDETGLVLFTVETSAVIAPVLRLKAGG